ncbi:hypothetical protein M405DRAFT_863463 [Rhizopogon salebrosus TDB-379]|nr:hypothetical protein M405DRAFT_863463 [Rhizopogon salebrosus TDB-379]
MNQGSTSDMRLPSYRTSYLLRFHPYPRVKLSNREMMTIDDRLGAHCDVAEEDETAELDSVIFADPQEEHHLNAVNLPEVIKVLEAGVQPRVRRVSLTTLVIDLAVLVTRKLSLKTK